MSIPNKTDQTPGAGRLAARHVANDSPPAVTRVAGLQQQRTQLLSDMRPALHSLEAPQHCIHLLPAGWVGLSLSGTHRLVPGNASLTEKLLHAVEAAGCLPLDVY